jgi:O-antigen ligase
MLPVAAAGLLVLSLAGTEVRQRFMTSFVEQRDFSAESRVELWLDCVTVMREYPMFGAGPDHFGLIAGQFGWPEGKEAHSLWFQLGAEVGPLGAILLLLFYLSIMRRVWPLASRPAASDDERWARHVAFMVFASLAGFIVSVQFVTMEGLETPLYVAAIAVATLRHERAAESPAEVTAIAPLLPTRRLHPIPSPARVGRRAAPERSMRGAALTRPRLD